MSTHLVYGRTLARDIGVRVVSYLEAEAQGAQPGPDGALPPIVNPNIPSFYYPPRGRPHYSARNMFQVMSGQDPRKSNVDKVVLHHDGMPNSQGCFNVLRDRSLSTHLMVDWDGTVFQPLDLSDTAYHAGGGVNGSSVGIDLCNPIRPERLDRRGDSLAARGQFSGTINGGTATSLGYTDAQYESLAAVLRGLKEVFPAFELKAPIDMANKVARSKLVDHNSFKGILAHWHVIASKWDPGPGFDWERLLIAVRGSQLWYPVTLKDTKNLAQTRKEEAFNEARLYFRNTEQGEGGYFPVGVNQAWHSGVHLNMDGGEPVLSPADGKILVARNTSVENPLGSPNFVLIRHELPVGKDQNKEVFSLLMHLVPERISAESTIPWIRRLVARGRVPGEALVEDFEGRRQSSPGLTGLAEGRVGLIEVEVKAGEIVGHVGTFATKQTTNAREAETSRKAPVLDFAMFSAQPLFSGNASPFLHVDEDKDKDILCNARAVWKLIVRKAEDLRGLVDGAYPLAPSDVREFYEDEDQATSMRWVAPKHPLEWSDTTVFDDLFGGGVDFEWSARKAARKYMQRIRPFLWWEAEVTAHAKLPADRLVYCYHPITLLAYVALGEARAAMRVGEDGQVKVLEGKDLEVARRRDRALEAQEGMSLTNCDLVEGDASDDATNTDTDLPDDPESEGWMRWEQGEWDPEQE